MADPQYDLPPGAKIISVPQQYDLPPGAKIVSEPRADRGGLGPGEPEVPDTSRSWGGVASGAVTSFLPSLYRQFEGIYDAVTNPAQTLAGLQAVGEGAGSKIDRLTGRNSVSPEEAKKAAELLPTLEGRDPSEQVILPGFGVGTVGDMLPRVQRAASFADGKGGRGVDAQKEAAFDMMVDHYVKRYGSLEGFKEALATDPAAVLLDMSTVLTMGGGLARGAANVATQGSKAAAIAGKTADVLSKAGAITDPVSQTLKGAGKVAGVIGDAAVEGLGVTTGGGSAPIRTAFDISKEAAGPQGFAMRSQERYRRLRDAMRGKADGDALHAEAQEALATLQADAGALYEKRKSGPTGWANDTTVLNFQPIRDTFDKVYGSLFNRQTGMSKVTDSAQMSKIEKIKEKIAEWEANPAGHTLEGLDDLKQAIWGLKGTPDQRQLNRVADSLYGRIKDIVNKQSDTIYQGQPNQYRMAQRDYEKTRGIIEEVERSLSLKDRGSTDTAVRKLLSVMRDNVQTNYGQRVKGVEILEDLGGANIMPDLAGMSLASKSPRGLMRAVAGADLLGAGGAALALNPQFAWALGLLPLTSPRLMGEGAVAAGRAAGAYDKFIGQHAAKAPAWMRGHPTTLGVGQLGQMSDIVAEKRGGHLRTVRGR